MKSFNELISLLNSGILKVNECLQFAEKNIIPLESDKRFKEQLN